MTRVNVIIVRLAFHSRFRVGGNALLRLVDPSAFLVRVQGFRLRASVTGFLLRLPSLRFGLSALSCSLGAFRLSRLS